MKQNLQVSLIQSKLIWQDIDANLERFEACISALPSTDLIVLPEMFTTGFSMQPELFAKKNAEASVSRIKTWASNSEAVICGSLIFEQDGQYFNRLFWVEPNGTVQSYDKRHLFTLVHEEDHYTAGSEQLIVKIAGWKVMPLICYDLRFPVWSRNVLDHNDEPTYDLAIYVANWPERRSYAWKSLLVARAIENQAYVIGLNRVGDDGNGIYHSGDSGLIDPEGEIVQMDAHDEKVINLVLDAELLQNSRKRFRFLKDGDAFTIN